MQNERKDEPRPRRAACQISNLKFQISDFGGETANPSSASMIMPPCRRRGDLCRDDRTGEREKARPTLLLRGWGIRTGIEEKAPHVNSTCWAPGREDGKGTHEALRNPQFLIDSALRFEIAVTHTKQRTGHVSNR